jgi:anthranilate phosphoribosyltransferase
MDMQSAIRAVIEKRNLSSEEMTTIMRTVMAGEATPAQIGGFLVGLRAKGETVEEIAAAASVMRELAVPVRVAGPHLVDVVGTGGDGSGTFNISTTCTFVVAAAGGKVAKHGNRSVSSTCGSADVLEAAGVKIDLDAEHVARCIDEVGVGFMFAPKHHGAMKHAAGPRREMGIRTLFNLLGPLTNPAGAPNQLLGVFGSEWVEPLAHVLNRLGSRHVLVVHADDGLDEITISGPTRVAELRDNEVSTYTVTPEQFGMPRSDTATLKADSIGESLTIMRAVLDNTAGPPRDIVALNSGAAIYAAGLSEDLESAVVKALDTIASGAAKARLEALVEISNRI